MKNFSNIVPGTIERVRSCGGGCIGTSYIIDSTEGRFFLKEYNKRGISTVEAQALIDMSEISGVSVPKVLSNNDTQLLLDFIEQGRSTSKSQKLLGYMLASLHNKKGVCFGYSINNFIGLSNQVNTEESSWITFYMKHRLGYQIKLAKQNGYMDVIEVYQSLEKHIPEILVGDRDEPTLVHGDLWSGNVIFGTSGEPYLIDPAAYYGTREADLAMTYVFGGFNRDFYSSYMEVSPLHSGWKERLAMYKLYHILNHLNLFGSSYRTEALQLMKYYL